MTGRLMIEKFGHFIYVNARHMSPIPVVGYLGIGITHVANDDSGNTRRKESSPK